MTKKIKPMPEIVNLAVKRDDTQERLDDVFEKLAGDLQRIFCDVGIDMRVNYQRKTGSHHD